MLDNDHPQSHAIFQASFLEDEIRVVLAACMKSPSELSADDRRTLVSTSIEGLYKLNDDHFQSDEEIRHSLDKLREALLQEPDVSVLWEKFLNLADEPGKNFGTCDI